MKRHEMIDKIVMAMLLAVFAYLILGQHFLPSDKMTDAYICDEYTGKWEHVTPDGKREPLTTPGRCEAKRNETVVMETTLPEDIGHHRYLCFQSAKQDMKFYIDGELRQEYTTKEHRLFGRMSAAAYVFVETTDADAGKTLRVETRTDSSYTGILYTVYAGNLMGIWSYFFQLYGVELMVAFVTLILSIVVIFASMMLRRFFRRRVPLEYLGWGTLIAAVWIIANSSFRQLIFSSLSVTNDITFLMIMLFALPYLLYMDEIQNGRYRKAYHIMEIIIIINFFVCTALHVTELCDFTDTISYVSAFCIFSIALIIITILLDLKKGFCKEYTYVAIGICGVSVAGFVQIISYFRRVSVFKGVTLAVGLIFLLVFSTISTIRQIMYMDREKQQALSASEAKGRFLANMSHEIRTPIHAILGMDAMILRESKETQIRAYALDIKSAGETLLSLINDILDISKIESGKLEIIPVDYDFSSLIHDIMNMIEIKARDKGLELHLSVDREIPSRLWGDDVRIRQILVNLMTNAVKYTETGSVTLTVRADVQGDMADVTFLVADTGIGIKEEDREKLFAEFERVEEKRNRNVEGTGLGMSITTRLLDQMGSKLEVKSVYGEGSVFSFTIRQKILNAEPVGDLEQRIKQQAVEYTYEVMFTAPEAQILLVDDNVVNRRVFVNLLKATKVKIDEASGGAQCLEMVCQKQYDLIFLDHMMPDIDGIEVLHEMQSWKDFPCKNTPVVALTANAVSGAKEMYCKEGFCDFLPKPVKPEKLEKMMMEMLPKEKVNSQPQKTESPEPETAKAEEEVVLPELDGIDWNYARLYCRDTAILKDTVQYFHDMTDTDAAQLEDIMKDVMKGEARQEALRQFRVKVHAMKNSAAMIGAISLAGVAKILEYAARDERAEVIGSITPVFLQEWRKMKDVLKPVVQSESAEQGKQAPDLAMITGLLQLLQGAMNEMDVDTADEIMKQLKRFAYTKESTKEILEKLDLAVTNLDEEQTAVWSEKMEEELR